MEDFQNDLNRLEKTITNYIIREDADTIFSLIKTEKDNIFSMEIIPYYALFVHSCQEYFQNKSSSEGINNKITDIRNFIKIYSDRFGKNERRILKVDLNHNETFKNQLKYNFMKSWNVHMNIGTFWTDDRHIIGNTQMMADCLGISDIFNSNNGEEFLELAREISSFICYIRDNLLSFISLPTINRQSTGINIEWYYDFNSNRSRTLFVGNLSKSENIFLLDLICNMNFIKYILRPLLDEHNYWIFRIEYIVAYYTWKALQRLKNHCEINHKVNINLDPFDILNDRANFIFNSKFRNCMMHYNLEGYNLISIENIDKPFYGIVENCFDGMNYFDFINELRTFSDDFASLLEKRLNIDNIVLMHL